jgi:hypothetical protein
MQQRLLIAGFRPPKGGIPTSHLARVALSMVSRRVRAVSPPKRALPSERYACPREDDLPPGRTLEPEALGQKTFVLQRRPFHTAKPDAPKTSIRARLNVDIIQGLTQNRSDDRLETLGGSDRRCPLASKPP